jgi:hypothetical protein
MEREGKYIYCIIETRLERNFGPLGIGDNEVLTIGYEDLSMVMSSHPLSKVVVRRENMLAHEKVIEVVMNEFDSVLPVRFGTVASNAEEVRNLLDRRYREFKNLLRDMDHKVELGVKGLWKDMKIVFGEIAKEDKKIRGLKRRIRKGTDSNTTELRIEIGKLVQDDLRAKKDEEGEKVIEALRGTALDYRLNSTTGDEMFINAAFLVDKGREKEFDNIMDDLSHYYRERATFRYTGPLPVFNFVNIVIYPEEWEK